MILLLSFLSAILMAGFSMGIKVMLRYRLCDAGYVIFGINIASGMLAGVVLLFVQEFIPPEAWMSFGFMTGFVFVGHWLFSKALQEGDASMVTPLLGLKIPLVAVLAGIWLKEAFSGGIYAAIVLSRLAIVFFGLGRQQKAQGGHGSHPVLAIGLAVLAALSYSVSDLFTRKTVELMSPVTGLLWLQMCMGIIGMMVLALPRYRQYQIRGVDYLLFGTAGAMLLGGIGLYMAAIRLAGNVTIPNIVLSWRGLFVFVMGLIWNAFALIPMERQSWKIYLLRLAGTGLLLAGLIFLYIS
jgi:drug/metabolite transporter (DMT)-like permease